MIKRIIKYFFALVTFAIPIYIYFTPPTDSDGGPMLAYNFLFFYPLLFLSSIISLILIYSATKKFKLNKIENCLILVSTLPTVILLILVFANIFTISNGNEYKEEFEQETSKKEIKISDKLTLKLQGYIFKNIRKKVEFIPYTENNKTYTTNQFVQGKYDTFFLYYKVENDSLIIYIPDDELLYYTNDGLKKLPIKVINSKKTPEEKNLNKFEW